MSRSRPAEDDDDRLRAGGYCRGLSILHHVETRFDTEVGTSQLAAAVGTCGNDVGGFATVDVDQLAEVAGRR